jgi:hypothetical protein
MTTNPRKPESPARRAFLRRAPFLLAACSAPQSSLWAQGDLHVLPQDRIDRLRMDFNASRSKVRLVSILSPT